MRKTLLILNFLLDKLMRQNFPFKDEIQLITFFDDAYPKSLYLYIWQVPVIYYRGEIKLLQFTLSTFLVSTNPSFYGKKAMIQVSSHEYTINLKYDNATYSSHKYDIIYCNDKNEFALHRSRLSISFFNYIHKDLRMSLILQLIDNLFVIDGYGTHKEFQIVNESLDLGINVFALPSNIFNAKSRLPNILIDEGASLILHIN